MANERIASLDSIRGIAMLGILFMNILAFALPYSAYSTPTWHEIGSLTDKWVFSVQQLLFDSRFRTLFCLLFGAGLALLWEKSQQRDYQPKQLLKRRLGWLLLFGFIHGTFVWLGDILFSYALGGLFVVATGIMRWEAGKLLKIGTLLFLAGHLLLTVFWFVFPAMPEEFIHEISGEYRLTGETLAWDVALWTGPYLGQVSEQLSSLISFNLEMILLGPFWAQCGLMMIGIALYKLGIFKTGLPSGIQWTLLVIGLALAGFDLHLRWQSDFLNPRDAVSPWNLIAALPMALVYLSVVARLSQRTGGVLALFSNAGRMAFTLYIFQSVTMVLLFRWIAPELYGQLDRLTLFGIALTMSILQLMLASAWLKRYRQGPLERMWRYLTYRKVTATAETN